MALPKDTGSSPCMCLSITGKICLSPRTKRYRRSLGWPDSCQSCTEIWLPAATLIEEGILLADPVSKVSVAESTASNSIEEGSEWPGPVATMIQPLRSDPATRYVDPNPTDNVKFWIVLDLIEGGQKVDLRRNYYRDRHCCVENYYSRLFLRITQKKKRKLRGSSF
ncbi:hypothetical protein J5N97_022502 [Dioscorea zingiberensis]|uniref:Uncharacterized protein n=1 Tax=Dioscorea zingiberensis TaxID=325984 RepID=A0A9D5CC28_9LILI|nr:hypothetical protein J5N97_022502 [Dioscorea zingiberensis]